MTPTNYGIVDCQTLELLHDGDFLRRRCKKVFDHWSELRIIDILVEII
jgi:hypothetical protein